MFQKYKHIIWDWNGTLFEDIWLCVSSINKLLAQRNLPALTINKYRAIFTLVLLIGDTIHDFEIAEAIGIDYVLVAGGHNSRERLYNSVTLGLKIRSRIFV